MKKIALALIAFLSLAWTLDGEASIQHRHVWWRIRLNKLIEKKALYEKKHTTPPEILMLMDKDIERTKNVLSVMEQYSKNDGSLRHEKKYFSEIEIASEVRKTVDPLFSLQYLITIIRERENRNNIRVLQALIDKNISNILNKDFGKSDDELVKAINRSYISKTHLNRIAKETFFNNMARNEQKSRKDCVERIMKNVTIVVNKKTAPLTIKELRDIIIDETNSFLEKVRFNKNPLSVIDLNNSPCWQSVAIKISREFKSYKIIETVLNNKTVSPPVFHLYYTDPGKLEKSVFNYLRACYRALNNNPADTTKNPGASYSEHIRGVKVLDMIDHKRRSMLFDITGKEDETYFRDLEKNFYTLFKDFIEQEKVAGNTQSGKANSLEKNANSISTKDQKKSGKNVFESEKKLLDKYVIKSLAFIKFVSFKNNLSADKIVADYDDRLLSYKQYLLTATMLYEESGTLVDLKQPQANKKYILVYTRMGLIIKDLWKSSVFEKTKLRHLTSAQIGNIKNSRADFLKSIKKTRSKLAALRLDYMSRSRKTKTKVRERNNEIKVKLGQFEVEEIVHKIDELVDHFRELHYAENIFRSYAASYSNLSEKLQKNTIPEQLEAVLKKNSLFSNQDDFNKNKIITEYKIRSFIRHEIRADLARLYSLVVYYKKNNIELKNCPPSAYFTETKKQINMKLQVPVAAWILTETNFMKIDRKIAHKLMVMRNQVLWKKKFASKEPSATNPQEHILQELDLSYSLPEGWQFGIVRDPHKGPITVNKIIESPDNRASITFASADREYTNLPDICNSWIKNSGNIILKQRWGKKGSMEYYWALSRGKQNQVMEAYLFRLKDRVLIVSGETPKRYYTMFREVITSVFHSINFDFKSGSKGFSRHN